MKKFVLLFFLIVIKYNSDAQDTIFWNKNRKLTFNDFRLTPLNKSNHFAITAYSHLAFIDGDSMIIKNIFLKQKSWIRDKCNYILTHEQIHFDLNEVSMRLYRKELSNFIFNLDKAQFELDSISEKIFIAGNLLQELYDEETQHSRNEACQAEWNTYIDQMLKELEAYSNPIVKLKFKEEEEESPR